MKNFAKKFLCFFTFKVNVRWLSDSPTTTIEKDNAGNTIIRTDIDRAVIGLYKC